MISDTEIIETRIEVINGKKVEVQIIPAGISGVNGVLTTSYFEEEEDFTIPVNDLAMEREVTEYLDEGIEPDSDEALAVKQDIEREQSVRLLDSFSEEDEVE